MSPLWRRRDDVETCDDCGFDGRSWRVRDAVTLLETLGEWWRLATDGIDGVDLDRRPSPEVWSANEYAVHSALVLGSLRVAVEEIAADDGVVLPAAPSVPGASPDDEPSRLDPEAVAAELVREATTLADTARSVPDAGWAHAGTVDGEQVTAAGVLYHAVHDASHHLMDVGRGLAALGVGTPRHAGGVAQVNASEGGVPKLPVPMAVITRSGLESDRQADRKHHGRPFQALCLWSSEVIDELTAEGHSVGAGAAGENVTVSGVRWDQLRPGTTLRVGTAVAELFHPAIPCAKQSRWFTDGDFSRIHHEIHPEWTRWYAWVRRPGAARAGDEVVVQP